MNRTTTAVVITAIATLALGACSSTGNDATAPTTAASTAAAQAGTSLHLAFGQTYTWPDGVKATITQAKVFTGYDKSLDEHPTTGSTDYQVMIKVTNGGATPLDLSTLSVITSGATNGGQADATSWTNAAPGLEGQLAPGVTATKGDAETLATRFGRRIVVTVQRTSAGGGVMAFPEFAGSITG